MAEGLAQFQVKVVPRASRNRLEVIPDGTLKAWVTAAPTDGQANEAVLSLISKALDVAPSRIGIVRGHSSRLKSVEVIGLSIEEARLRLAKQR